MTVFTMTVLASTVQHLVHDQGLLERLMLVVVQLVEDLLEIGLHLNPNTLTPYQHPGLAQEVLYYKQFCLIILSHVFHAQCTISDGHLGYCITVQPFINFVLINFASLTNIFSNKWPKCSNNQDVFLKFHIKFDLTWT
jgi:hypothetical protein